MPKLALALALILFSGTSCMISEQSGQGLEDLAFHFDTDFNRIMLLARSGAIALVAIWILASFKKKPVPSLIAVALLVLAGGLFAKDYPMMSGYRIEVLGEGLVLLIPPEPEKTIPWSSIEEMYIEGVGPVNRQQPRDAVARMLELPDWHSMRLTLHGGESHLVDLKPLSIEQRQGLWRAIARRAQLVEVDE